MAYKVLVDNQAGPGGTDVPFFVGYASPGTATSVAAWRIAHITYDASDTPTAVLYANGSDSFTNIWDNRAGLAYS
jgi:hypothetical protein